MLLQIGLVVVRTTCRLSLSFVERRTIFDLSLDDQIGFGQLRQRDLQIVFGNAAKFSVGIAEETERKSVDGEKSVFGTFSRLSSSRIRREHDDTFRSVRHVGRNDLHLDLHVSQSILSVSQSVETAGREFQFDHRSIRSATRHEVRLQSQGETDLHQSIRIVHHRSSANAEEIIVFVCFVE